MTESNVKVLLCYSGRTRPTRKDVTQVWFLEFESYCHESYYSGLERCFVTGYVSHGRDREPSNVTVLLCYSWRTRPSRKDALQVWFLEVEWVLLYYSGLCFVTGCILMVLTDRGLSNLTSFSCTSGRNLWADHNWLHKLCMTREQFCIYFGKFKVNFSSWSDLFSKWMWHMLLLFVDMI